MKADFIPQLDDEDDTSYFDTRSERYDHADTDTETRSSAEDSLEDAPLFRSFSSCSPRYRKVHNKSREVFRHSISQCESSDTSDVTSLSSLANSPITTPKETPVLRRQSEMVSEAGVDRAANAKSCPDLETMIATSGMRIPGTGGLEQVSPKLQRNRNRHRHTKSDQLPKFSISLEEAEAFALQAGLSDFAVSGPTSLPVTSLGLNRQHCPEIPSPLVRSERPAPSSMVKSTSATGLSLFIPPPVQSSTPTKSQVQVSSLNRSLIQTIRSPGGSSTASSRDASPGLIKL